MRRNEFQGHLIVTLIRIVEVHKMMKNNDEPPKKTTVWFLPQLGIEPRNLHCRPLFLPAHPAVLITSVQMNVSLDFAWPIVSGFVSSFTTSPTWARFRRSCGSCASACPTSSSWTTSWRGFTGSATSPGYLHRDRSIHLLRPGPY